MRIKKFGDSNCMDNSKWINKFVCPCGSPENYSQLWIFRLSSKLALNIYLLLVPFLCLNLFMHAQFGVWNIISGLLVNLPFPWMNDVFIIAGRRVFLIVIFTDSIGVDFLLLVTKLCIIQATEKFIPYLKGHMILNHPDIK